MFPYASCLQIEAELGSKLDEAEIAEQLSSIMRVTTCSGTILGYQRPWYLHWQGAAGCFLFSCSSPHIDFL